jgi:hypothetical protein
VKTCLKKDSKGKEEKDCKPLNSYGGLSYTYGTLITGHWIMGLGVNLGRLISSSFISSYKISEKDIALFLVVGFFLARQVLYHLSHSASLNLSLLLLSFHKQPYKDRDTT